MAGRGKQPANKTHHPELVKGRPAQIMIKPNDLSPNICQILKHQLINISYI
jgi:hypothetical protein